MICSETYGINIINKIFLYAAYLSFEVLGRKGRRSEGGRLGYLQYECGSEGDISATVDGQESCTAAGPRPPCHNCGTAPRARPLLLLLAQVTHRHIRTTVLTLEATWAPEEQTGQEGGEAHVPSGDLSTWGGRHG